MAHERASGAPVHLATLRAPDCFGEIGLLEGTARTATVRAGSGGARPLVLARDTFAQLRKGESAGADLATLAAQRLAASAAAGGLAR